MKKAVITTGGKQYLVQEGETLKVELIKATNKKLSFEPLMVIDGDKVKVGQPTVKDSSVSAEIVDADSQAEKVTSIRFKAKKRVKTVRGHRQRYSTIKVSMIA